MPEHLRALIVILAFATTIFAFTHRPALSITEAGNITRRRNLWFALTLSAFFSHNFWVYTLIAIPLLIHANRHETNSPSLFFFILFALPAAPINIPGMGLVNFLFDLSHARILALFILLPAFFSLRKVGDNPSFGRTGPDKALTFYLLLTVILSLRDTSLTDTLRQAFYLFIDIFLPYIVISRSLKNLQAFRDALLSLVLAIMVLAPIAVFESSRHWLLYQSLVGTLELREGAQSYLERNGMLRAIASAGQAIPLGYLMVVGIGFYLFLQRSIQRNSIRRLGMVLLAAGLIAPLSRGPWVGAAVLLVVFIATGRYAARRLISLALAAMLVLPLVSMLPGGEKVINLLPFIGSTEKSNIDYREKLITNSVTVIKRNPWFGSINYLDTPEMQSLRQGQNIIDIVNTYISVALEKGFVGLGLFVSFFFLTLLGIYRAMSSIPDRDSEEHLLGRVLLATLLAILIIIFTVSSITVIPIVYWSVAGLGVAYAQMIRKNIDSMATERTSMSAVTKERYSTGNQ
jgi:O-antigen ligase